MPLTLLNLNGPELQAQLDRLAVEQKNDAEISVDTAGVEAEVSRTWANGWGVVAYAKAKWSGETTAGGRLTKKF